MIIKNKLDNTDSLNSLNLKMSVNYTVEKLIEISVDKFNKNFKENKIMFCLNENSNKYDLKPSKKNGEPKTDLPGKF
jgi:hypothetical protein